MTGSVQDRYRAAVARHRAGDWAAAAAGYRAVLRDSPGMIAAYNNLGDALCRLGRLDEALALLATAAEKAPEEIAVKLQLANVERLLGRLDAAARTLREAIALKPYHVEAICDLALVEEARGDRQAAIARFEAALELNPLFAQGHYNYANCLSRLGRTGEAEAHYREAIRLRPEMAEAHNNLGVLLRMGERWDEAEEAFAKAAELAADKLEPLFNLGSAQLALGKAEAADATFAEAGALRPDAKVRLRRATLLPVIAESRAEIMRARARMAARLAALETDKLAIDDPLSECDWTAFYLAYQGENDRALQQQRARLLAAACPALTENRVAGRRPRATGAPVRLGLVSSYFRDHTIGHLFKGLIAALRRGPLETWLFQVGPADDPVNAEIRAAADRYAALPRDLAEARAAIAEARLDTLLYTDIGMDAATYYLAFARLAPVQMVGWGHPVTTGIANLDYFISAELFDSESAESHYSERLIRLSRLLLCQQLPALDWHAKGRAELGFPEEGTVYFCPQSLFKLHPDFDPILAEILRRDANGRLCLLSGHRRHWNDLLAQRLRHRLGALAERVVFLPHLARDDFLRALAVADVVLDTPHFSGGKTSLECLAAGTPLVTLPSPYLRGRLTYGFYKRMGVSDCIARTPQAYAEIAVRLGTDGTARRRVTEKIRAANRCLFDDRDIVREFEAVVCALVDEAEGR